MRWQWIYFSTQEAKAPSRFFFFWKMAPSRIATRITEHWGPQSRTPAPSLVEFPRQEIRWLHKHSPGCTEARILKYQVPRYSYDKLFWARENSNVDLYFIWQKCIAKGLKIHNKSMLCFWTSYFHQERKLPWITAFQSCSTDEMQAGRVKQTHSGNQANLTSQKYTWIRATSPTCMVITPSSHPIRNKAVSATLMWNWTSLGLPMNNDRSLLGEK